MMIFHLDDFQLVVADVSNQSLTVYDSLRRKLDLTLLKKFVCDYCDVYGPNLWLTSDWKEEKGNCVQDLKN